MGVKISQLPALVGELAGTELLEVADGTGSKRVTSAQLGGLAWYDVTVSAEELQGSGGYVFQKWFSPDPGAAVRFLSGYLVVENAPLQTASYPGIAYLYLSIWDSISQLSWGYLYSNGFDVPVGTTATFSVQNGLKGNWSGVNVQVYGYDTNYNQLFWPNILANGSTLRVRLLGARVA
jgi:hypothetical protein